MKLRVLILIFLAVLKGWGQTGALSGYVLSTVDHSPLPFANIRLAGTPLGTISDENGYFFFVDLEPRIYTVEVSYIGYKTQKIKVSVASGIHFHLEIRLQPIKLQGQRVIVSAERARFERSIEISRIHLGPRQIQEIPAVAEADLFRSLQSLPSVTAQNDFNAALIVRGGSPDENLILLDGVEIYNPYHFGGIFSAFNLPALQQVEFLAGGLPAQYGGRLSSALVIQSKAGVDVTQPSKIDSGNTHRIAELTNGQLDLSLLSTNLFLQGTVRQVTWALSGRRTYFDQLAALAHELNDTLPEIPYFFYDTQLHLRFPFRPGQAIQATYFQSQDNLDLAFTGPGGNQDFRIHWIWGNKAYGATMKNIIGPRLILTSRIASSEYGFKVRFKARKNLNDTLQVESSTILIRDALEDRTLEQQVSWTPNRRHEIRFGWIYKAFDFGFRFSFLSSLDSIDMLSQNYSPRLFSAFVQDTWHPSPLFSLQMGERLYRYSYFDKWFLDWRIGSKYRLSTNLVLQLSLGLFHQFIFTTNSDDDILRVVDFWAPVPSYAAPQKAHQLVAGVEYWLEEGYRLSWEVFYKPYANLLDSNPFQKTNVEDDDYLTGTGWAYGSELLLKKNLGRITGWMAYSYSKVEKRIDLNGNKMIEPDQGEEYPPSYDRRHSLKLVAMFRLNPRHSLSLAWNWSTGQPYTPVIGKQYGGNWTAGWFTPYNDINDLSGFRGSARFPNYSRLDFQYQRALNWFGWQGKFTFQVINLLNHFNVLFYQWDHSVAPSRVQATSMFPFFPTLGLSFRF